MPILFKKWSNKSYAIFNSIGKVIHIGFISPIVSRLVTVKALVNHEFFRIFDSAGELSLDNNEQLLKLSEVDGLILSTGLPHDITPNQTEEDCCLGAVSNNKSFLKVSLRPNSGLFYFVLFLSTNRKIEIFYISDLHAKI